MPRPAPSGQRLGVRRGPMAVLVASILAVSAGAQSPHPASDLRLSAPISTWDEAIPLGNGLLGGLLWGRENRLVLSLDRGDLWDQRAAAPFGQPGYTWPDLQRLVRENKADSLRLRFDDPYDKVPFPTKIPAGRLTITFDTTRRATAFGLRLGRAEGWADLSGQEMRGFFSATERVAVFQLPTPRSVTIERPGSLDQLGYGPATVGATGALQWMVQRAAEGLTYVIASGLRPTGDGRSLLVVTITTSRDGPNPVAMAQQRVRRALARGYDASMHAHLAWWRRFWSSSSVTLPDSALQSHVDLVTYYYGAASRRGAPPMPLQGVWTADGGAPLPALGVTGDTTTPPAAAHTGSLPPWKGDFHNDLNSQMTYLATHVAGLDDAVMSWLDFNWDRLPAYRTFARDFYGVKGAAVPGVMTLDGKALGGWAQYSLSPTMGAWVAQSFYLQWRATMDPRFLRERAYPFTSEIGTALSALLTRDADGHLRLPLSTSPEIFDNSMQAWLPSPSSFDTALLRWLFGALDEMATALSRPADAGKWRTVAGGLGPLATDPSTGSLGFAAGLPYDQSHRHFSHAMAIHPLGIMAVDGADSTTVRATLDRIAAAGTDWWTGYSYSWFSAMLAHAGRGDEALRYLETYQRAFILRNGFHANGDQTKSGLSKYTYRPFTLEGNFLALNAVHEMLLQNQRGVMRVFPAVSARWRDVSFRHLRADGGFVVSAERVGGRTVRVEIRSPRGGTLRLRDPFGGGPAQWSHARVRCGDDCLSVQLKAGERLVGRRSPG